MSNLLLLSASAIFLVAFVMYNKGIITGANTPAFAAWGVFSLISAVNCATYLSWTENWINVAVLFSDFVVCTGTVLIVLIRRGLKVRVDWFDGIVALISVIAIVLWKLSDASVGNWFNQIAYSMAFIPTYRNAWRNPKDEPTKPWLLWAIAFAINIVALALRENSQPMDYVSPVICLIYHSIMVGLSLRQPKKVQ